MQRFRGGLVFKAHRNLYHSTIGLGVIKKKTRDLGLACDGRHEVDEAHKVRPYPLVVLRATFEQVESRL